MDEERCEGFDLCCAGGRSMEGEDVAEKQVSIQTGDSSHASVIWSSSELFLHQRRVPEVVV